jgi:formiminotetrahydrofolate cyclodeaminase
MADEQPLFLQQTLAGFLDGLAGIGPAPGGVSTAAIAGALASALIGKVATVTLRRKLNAASEAEMTALRGRAAELQAHLARLAHRDAHAYSQLLAAYHLPQSTVAERTWRLEAVQHALRAAVETPIATSEACLQVLELAAQATRVGARVVTSDALVAARLAHAGTLGAVDGALANLSSIRDAGFRAETTSRLRAASAACDEALAAAVAAASQACKGI